MNQLFGKNKRWAMFFDEKCVLRLENCVSSTLSATHSRLVSGTVTHAHHPRPRQGRASRLPGSLFHHHLTVRGEGSQVSASPWRTVSNVMPCTTSNMKDGSNMALSASARRRPCRRAPQNALHSAASSARGCQPVPGAEQGCQMVLRQKAAVVGVDLHPRLVVLPDEHGHFRHHAWEGVDLCAGSDGSSKTAPTKATCF